MKKLILTCILSLSLLVASSPASALESKTTAVTLSNGKKSVTYVSFHPSEPLELKPVLAHNKVGFTEELAKMAQRNQAIAAMNGTFFNPYDTKDLQPLGALAINQRMEHFRGGPVALGITQQNELWFDATKSIAIRGSINGSNEWPHNWYAWFINHAPTSQDEIVIFTPSYRTTQLDFPQFSFVVVNDGKVTSISQNKATIPAKGFVIAYRSSPTNQDQLQRFQVGDTVSYQVIYPNGVNSPQHLLSAGPKLVTNGKVSLDFAGFTEDKITKNPGQRSFIGRKADQTILIGTVSNVTMKELAELVIKLGLTEAMNLDGGASSGLYYNGKYLTKPGRLLSNSLVLVKKEKKQVPAIQVMINGVPQRYDQPPMMVQYRTLVPLRGIFETLGAEVQWHAETETVIATKGEIMVNLRKGAKEAMVNGQLVPLDVAAQPVNGRMMVPARFVSEALGAKVEWDSQSFLVKITTE